MPDGSEISRMRRFVRQLYSLEKCSCKMITWKLNRFYHKGKSLKESLTSGTFPFPKLPSQKQSPEIFISKQQFNLLLFQTNFDFFFLRKPILSFCRVSHLRMLE